MVPVNQPGSYKEILNHFYTNVEIVNNQYKPDFSGNTTNEVKQ